MLESIVACIVMFDPDDQCVVTNQNLCHLLGTEEGDLLGRHLSELERLLDRVFPHSNLLSPGTPTGTRIISTREPRQRHYTQYWKPVQSSDGTSLGKIFAFRDVTRETEVDRMKSDFIATVSHELRTPLTAIKGSLGLMASGAAGALSTEQFDLMTVALRNVERLNRLVNDILDVSRMNAGHLEMHREHVDLNTTVMLAVQSLESVRRQREIQLTSELAPELPIVEADPHRISQVIINLLGNAYKFTQPKGRVWVQTFRFDGEVWVRVADSGPGIPPNQLESIFDRFVRAPGTGAAQAGGSGLGLAIARGIVQGHSGRIWAENLPGRGAAFTFTLPVG